MVPTSFTVGLGLSTPVVVLLRKYRTGYIGCSSPPPSFFFFLVPVHELGRSSFLKCWTRYPKQLLLPVILDHAFETICEAFETICEVSPGSCVKRYIFIFCLGPDILPQFRLNLDFVIFKT